MDKLELVRWTLNDTDLAIGVTKNDKTYVAHKPKGGSTRIYYHVDVMPPNIRKRVSKALCKNLNSH